MVPIKIGVSGTHSTGKSTFANRLGSELTKAGLKVGRVDDLATHARKKGFPILTGHTFESTLWIMAECLRQEAELSLSCDAIIVDRPVPDALGYLYAALELTHRSLPTKRKEQLETIARVCASDYEFLAVTKLDRSIPLGEGRDTDNSFREAAARCIDNLMAEIAPAAHRLSVENVEDLLSQAMRFVLARRGGVESR